VPQPVEKEEQFHEKESVEQRVRSLPHWVTDLGQYPLTPSQSHLHLLLVHSLASSAVLELKLELELELAEKQFQFQAAAAVELDAQRLRHFAGDHLQYRRPISPQWRPTHPRAAARCSTSLWQFPPPPHPH
jgi:hypothetical protein